MASLRRSLATYGKAVTKSLWTLGPGLATARGRRSLRQIASVNPWRGRPGPLPRFAPVEADTLHRGVDIRIVPYAYRSGEISDVELRAICSLVRRHSPLCIFEIGTFRGKTTLHMALNSPPEAKVYTLDLPADQADLTKLELDPTARDYIGQTGKAICFISSPLDERWKISQLWGDSAVFDFEPYRGTCDFVFVDGAHSYDYVINDTKAAFSLLRDGKGVIVWHDYAMKRQPGVRKALEELGDDPRYGAMSRCRWIRGTSLAYVVAGENSETGTDTD